MSLTTRFVSGFGRSQRDQAAAADGAAEVLDGELALLLVRAHEAQSNGWFWATDRAGRLVYLTDRVATSLQRGDEPVLEQMLTDIFEVSGESEGSERTLAFHLHARTSFANFEVRSRGGRERDRVWLISGRPHIDDLGQFRGFVGHGADLSAERRSDAEIKRLAMTDPLTGLANRARMRASLDQIIVQLERMHRPVALFMLDLDRFKAVNDTLGHQSGDRLLKVVSQRLERCVGEMGLVGRLGGDEFQVIVSNYRNVGELEQLAERIISSLSQPYFIQGTDVLIGCSVGISIAPDHGREPEILIRNADLSLYEAKAQGRGKFNFFRPELLTQAQTKKTLEDDLRRALERGEFWLAYQPVVSAATSEIVGYEALIRWTHPTLGPVSPADFIPIAEDSRLIDPIGEWVLRTACDAAASWPRPVRVAVNVSTIQFARPTLPAMVANALASSGLAPGRLELEITESVFLNEDASTERMLKTLKQTGVRLALDDFGTGYSSLAYLKKAPFDKVKIDQSFVKGAAHDPRNTAIIRAVTTIAETLGLETTAEGVETQDEIELIRSLGCSHIQGFVFGKPVPNAEVMTALAGAGAVEPVGLKMSRSPRQRLLRSSRIEHEGKQSSARIRDVSATGMMIDGFAAKLRPGDKVRIERMDGRMVPAVVVWTNEGRAGLKLDEEQDLSTGRGR
jgi:diguanylate cyclase (GGDEF)-like protein